MISKDAIRSSMIARRRQLDPAEKESCGKAIQETFLGLSSYVQADSIALYLPVKGEVPTDRVMNHSLASGKTIYLPVIDGETIVLRHCSHLDELKPGRFGIMEPSEWCETTKPQHIDVIVVPGVVFDLAGNRSGYGKGYYDRLLASCRDATPLIGFCYDFQLVESIAVEPHDVRMDMVITERRVISVYC